MQYKLIFIINAFCAMLQSSDLAVTRYNPDPISHAIQEIENALDMCNELQAERIVHNIITNNDPKCTMTHLLQQSISQKRLPIVKYFQNRFPENFHNESALQENLHPDDRQWITDIQEIMAQNRIFILNTYQLPFDKFCHQISGNIDTYTLSKLLIVICQSSHPNSSDQVNKAKFLLEKGANPNAIVFFNHRSAHCLTTLNHELLSILLQRGANPNQIIFSNITRLHQLLSFTDPTTSTTNDTLLLLKHGATVPQNLSPKQTTNLQKARNVQQHRCIQGYLICMQKTYPNKPHPLDIQRRMQAMMGGH